jgi:hypothetical protein
MSGRIVDDFKKYADVVFGRFGNRIKVWITMNEPQTVCDLGYNLGVHAPGLVSSRRALLGQDELGRVETTNACCWRRRRFERGRCMVGQVAVAAMSMWRSRRQPFQAMRRHCLQANGAQGAFDCAHNMLLAHAAAYRLYKSKYAASQVRRPKGRRPCMAAAVPHPLKPSFWISSWRCSCWVAHCWLGACPWSALVCRRARWASP